MILTITIARKPVEGTVAQNVLKFGVGGLNVDGSRIKTGESLTGGAYAMNPGERVIGQTWGADRQNPNTSFKRGGAGAFEQPIGRWPANLILSHLSGCKLVGVDRVKGITGGFKEGSSGAFNGRVFLKSKGQPEKPKTYADSEGKETIDKWECQEGCPAKGFPVASANGYRANPSTNKTMWFGAKDGSHVEGERGFNDSGSASRFFKQVQEEEWECVEGCPAKEFPEVKPGIAVQRNGGGQKIGGNGIYGGSKGSVRPDSGYPGESGSASRFFKQVKDE